MNFTEIGSIDANIFYLVIFPMLICLSRVADVILGTIRIVFVIQGRKFLATLFGFFEVFIWVSVASQILGQVSNIFYNLAWSLGFALGTYLGILIEEKISMGDVILRVISKKGCLDLDSIFISQNIKVLEVEAHSSNDNVTIYFAIVPRKKLKNIEKLILEFSPDTVYTVESLKSVHYESSNFSKKDLDYFRRFFPRRKSK